MNPLFCFPAPKPEQGLEWPFVASATIEVIHKQHPHMSHEERMNHISHLARINFARINH